MPVSHFNVSAVSMCPGTVRWTHWNGHRVFQCVRLAAAEYRSFCLPYFVNSLVKVSESEPAAFLVNQWQNLRFLRLIITFLLRRKLTVLYFNRNLSFGSRAYFCSVDVVLLSQELFFILICLILTMNLNRRDEIVTYLADGRYPEGMSENDKRQLRRTAKSFVLKNGRTLYHFRDCKYITEYLFSVGR